MRQGYPLSPLLFNIVLEFLGRSMRQEVVIKGIQIGKEIDKGYMILYLKDPKNLPKTPRHHKQLQQCSRYKINLQKSIAFLYSNNEQIKKEYRKIIPFTID
jgi:hypothetical protein